MWNKSAITRILIVYLIATLTGFVTGYGRLLVWFFLPGIQGAVLGAVLAFTMGSLLADNEEWKASFLFRTALILDMALLVYLAQALVPAFVMTGWDPLFLPGAILDGHFREVMTGASIYSFTVQHGPLTPGWWLFMQGLDMLFFFFFGLICLGIGFGKNRSGFAPWKPLAIVLALCGLVLASTASVQTFHKELLIDWQASYGGGQRYLDWREKWIATGLREDRVREFLTATEKVTFKQVPQLAVLRGIGYVRLGDQPSAFASLDTAIEAAQQFPGPIRMDLTRRLQPSQFIRHVSNLKEQIVLRPAPIDEAQLLSQAVPSVDDWFPYEGILE